MFATKTKKQPTSTDHDAAWFDLPTMARAFDVTPQGFHRSIRPLVPEADIKAAGERGQVRIRCRGAIDGYAARKVEQATEAARKGADPLLTGGDSPELERYRRARANLAELELGERNGSLIRREQLEPAFTQFASAIRRAGESLQRRFGNDAAQMLNEAISDAEQIIRQSFGGQQ